ncbi:hydroxymethylglutaryl-CoA lyase [Streptomyces ochraceiscleroticus]|uniref:Hydroxymethylglutaryl-CoA lyase n=1 Tax=Streptomyces ochraceiscleroticus TaxID=47761 RepID=A0ABW1MJB4_9ACTN|nr:hydroxymethylglutaryl-CoA lyase [Streptomyces ochraceiscleroticus]
MATFDSTSAGKSAGSSAPDVVVTDVVLRDGLQDEPVFVPVPDRVALAGALATAGIPEFEAASFVSARRVPQMAGAEELLAALPRSPEAKVAGLALSPTGARRGAAAYAAGQLDVLRLVVSADPGHSVANSGRGVDQALDEIGETLAVLPPSLTVEAGVSTAFVGLDGGLLPTERLLYVVRRLHDLGARRIGLADTLGTAPTEHVVHCLSTVLETFPDLTVGLHLHNAHGQALRTVDAALGLGVVRFDSALGGLGGCPFAPGAHGNLATEELVAHLHARGLTTGIDETALAEAGSLLSTVLARATAVPA